MFIRANRAVGGIKWKSQEDTKKEGIKEETGGNLLIEYEAI